MLQGEIFLIALNWFKKNVVGFSCYKKKTNHEITVGVISTQCT